MKVLYSDKICVWFTMLRAGYLPLVSELLELELSELLELDEPELAAGGNVWLMFAETFEFDARIALDWLRLPVLMLLDWFDGELLPLELPAELAGVLPLVTTVIPPGRKGLMYCQKMASAPFDCNATGIIQSSDTCHRPT